MSRDEIEVLREQLSEVLAEPLPDPLEIAGLAGLLARIAPEDPLLERAPRAASGDTLDRLADFAAELLEALEDCDEDTEPEVAWDRLAGLDEASATATWLHAPERVRHAVEDAQHTISAFPEAWSAQSALASRLLRSRPPLPGDPAGALWRTVEAAALGLPHDPANAPGAPGSVRIAAGLDQVIQLAPLRAQAQRAASAMVPAPPPWTTLREGSDWSAGLTTLDGAVWLIIEEVAQAGSCTLRVEHNGRPVELTRMGAAWRCEAAPGQWRVADADTSLAFTLTDDA